MGEREDMLAQFGMLPIPTPGLAPTPLAGGPGLGFLAAREQQQARMDQFAAKMTAPDENSPEAWQAAARDMGAPDGVRSPNDPRAPLTTRLMQPMQPSPEQPKVPNGLPNGPVAPVNTNPFGPPNDSPPTRESSGSPVRPMMGGGGGFGNLDKNARDAQDRQRAGFDTASDLERQAGVEHAGATYAKADLAEANALRMQRDAEDQQRIDGIAADKHEQFLARQETLANDLAKQQIDPGRLLRNADTATQMMMGLGAALGGAFGNGRNDYLDRLDKLVDRDINAQIQDIDSKKASFGARQSLFGQMLAETGDRRLAAMQTRSLIYDSMDRKLKADADRLGIPEMRTNAEIKATEIQGRKQALDVQIAQAALQQARAAAQAQVAAQNAAQERAYQRLKDAEHLKLEYYKVDASNAGKAGSVEERRVVIDGKDAIATSKQAADEWGKYSHGRAVVADMLEKLKAAREAGNVGQYDAARGLLIEEVPKLLGYAKGPSMGQIRETLGPEVVPKYNHWYDHYGLSGAGLTGYTVEQGRSAEKLKVLEDLLSTSDRAVREQTFGAKVGAEPAAPRFTPDAKPAGK